ncbi:MAG: hypothetical protein MST10_06130 [Lentisphaeria bacterium]|nr:hypothetical protein [Lentisphaeria bacterium]
MKYWHKFLLGGVALALLQSEIAAGAEAVEEHPVKEAETVVVVGNHAVATLDLENDKSFQLSYAALVRGIPTGDQEEFARNFAKIWTNELLTASEAFGDNRKLIWLQMQNKFNNSDYNKLKQMIAEYEKMLRLAVAAADKVTLNYRDKAALEASLSEMAKCFPPEARVEFMNQYTQIYYGLVFQSNNTKITTAEAEAQGKKYLDGKNYSQLMELYRKLIENGQSDVKTPFETGNQPPAQMELRFDTSSEQASQDSFRAIVRSLPKAEQNHFIYRFILYVQKLNREGRNKVQIDKQLNGLNATQLNLLFRGVDKEFEALMNNPELLQEYRNMLIFFK